MKKINDGGPAFPNFFATGDVPRGMSLRQAYAKAVLSEELITQLKVNSDLEGRIRQSQIKTVVRLAFDIADAMIAFEEEEKKQNE